MPLTLFPKVKVLILLFVFSLSAHHLSAQSSVVITSAANQFLSTLSADELKKVSYPFTDTLRHKWSNFPVGLVPREGVQYGSLSDKSRIAFHEMLTSLLSSQGYLKLTSIMQLDDVLNTLYQQAFDKKEIDENMLKQMKNLKWSH